ncbi:Rieske 2Fe-2S domain-containing protein [Haloarcula sp. S1CR25-12]|uniref:Rieske 2Fe-2S domain-containing protein n=1 Tax=Haloarcula saliterrae TaxID=2950534 RepID=A0ABU2F6M4_9EURY|nr:Rieske 2Fe-2S domain-containing protein [Haloarcula sp. S1CR25-12]MDS0257842.1 Rieske 2Fe-2S domain-containing protein [Haloarcula sp. S1CR25-12]
MHQLTSVERVHDDGSYLFTAEGPHGAPEEVIVVPCGEGVEAWRNRCTHEDQRFDTGQGVPMRDGEIICPRHGSLFDACEGDCDNGEAAGTTLPAVDLAERHGTVFLVDDDYEFAHEGGIDDDEGPSSTSHLGL